MLRWDVMEEIPWRRYPKKKTQLFPISPLKENTETSPKTIFFASKIILTLSDTHQNISCELGQDVGVSLHDFIWNTRHFSFIVCCSKKSRMNNSGLFRSLPGRVVHNSNLFQYIPYTWTDCKMGTTHNTIWKPLLCDALAKVEVIPTSSFIVYFVFDFSCHFKCKGGNRNASLFGNAGVVNKLNESHLYAHKSRVTGWDRFKNPSLGVTSTLSLRCGSIGQPWLDRAINCPFSVWKVIGIRVLRLYSPISSPFRTCLMRHGSKKIAATAFALYRRPIKVRGSFQTRNCSFFAPC